MSETVDKKADCTETEDISFRRSVRVTRRLYGTISCFVGKDGTVFIVGRRFFLASTARYDERAQGNTLRAEFIDGSRTAR